MSKRRDSSSDDDFDPFDDLLSDDDFNTSSPLKDDDDIDILKLANDDDDELIDEIGRRGRPRQSGGGGGADVGGMIGGLIRVILIAIVAVVIFLAIGAGVVIGGRAVGILPGGSLDLSTLRISSLVVPTQPPALEATSVIQGDAVGAEAPVAAAIVPTSEIQLPTFAPTPTPVPDCRQEDVDAWWAQQESNYNRFSAITAESIGDEQNVGAYLEQLRLQREYSAAVASDACTAYAQQSLIRFLDATMERTRALTAAPGTDAEALTRAEASMTSATAAMTAALWDVNVLVEADSPVALGIERGSSEACGANLWLAQVETIYTQFMGYAGQVSVTLLSPSSVRELITNMQAVQGNAANVTVPECATVPSQLLQEAMSAQVSVFENQMAGRTDTANAAQADFERIIARYQAWVTWLRG